MKWEVEDLTDEELRELLDHAKRGRQWVVQARGARLITGNPSMRIEHPVDW